MSRNIENFSFEIHTSDPSSPFSISPEIVPQDFEQRDKKNAKSTQTPQNVVPEHGGRFAMFRGNGAWQEGEEARLDQLAVENDAKQAIPRTAEEIRADLFALYAPGVKLKTGAETNTRSTRPRTFEDRIRAAYGAEPISREEEMSPFQAQLIDILPHYHTTEDDD